MIPPRIPQCLRSVVTKPCLEKKLLPKSAGAKFVEAMGKATNEKLPYIYIYISLYIYIYLRFVGHGFWLTLSIIRSGTLRALWAFLGGSQTTWGTKCPQEPSKRHHPRNKPTNLETCCSFCFSWFSFYFLLHKAVLIYVFFFSSIVGSPCALHGMGSYAIRTRRRSPNTLFSFRFFSKNSF